MALETQKTTTMTRIHVNHITELKEMFPNMDSKGAIGLLIESYKKNKE